MPVTHEGYIEYSQQDIQGMFRFFGSKSLFVDSVRVETNPDGSVGNRAIGFWRVTDEVCTDHFAKFKAQFRSGEEEVNTQLMPGHFGPELLGQTLGVLVAARYPNHLIRVLPSYRRILGIAYEEPIFPEDRVNVCVQLISDEFDEKDRLRSFNGSGVIIFNGKLVSAAYQMVVNVNPLELAVRRLAQVRLRHQTEEWVPASFDQFDIYFASAEKMLHPQEPK